MRTLASICGVTVGERVRGRCPSLNSTHVGVVTEVHPPHLFDGGPADVTITDDACQSRLVCFLHRENAGEAGARRGR